MPDNCHACGADECVCRWCIVCARQRLGGDLPQTCRRCVDRARYNLARAVELYALLPVAILDAAYGQPGRARNGPRSAETPFPGGVGLAMLSSGSQGRSQTRTDIDTSHEADEVEGDPASVLFILASWEDDWRHHFGDPAAGRATVAAAAGYLNQRVGEAAQRHPAFDEFAADLRRLRRDLERVLALHDDVERARDAECLAEDCGGMLTRRADDEHGLPDEWECDECHTGYDETRMALARRTWVDKRAEQHAGLVAMTTAAMVTGTNFRTVQTWVNRGRIDSHRVDGQRLVRLTDVLAAARDLRDTLAG